MAFPSAVSLVRAQILAEQILPKRPAKALCDDHIRGLCRAGSRCAKVHDIYRLWEERAHPWTEDELTGFDNFLTLEPRVISKETPFENDGPGRLSRYGCRHDNDFVDIRNIRILPTTDEILCDRRPYMPSTQNDSSRFLKSSAARLLDKTFRQLRYDSVESLRDVCYHASQLLCSTLADNVSTHLQSYRQATPQGNRYALFYNVDIEGLCACEYGIIGVQVSFACPPELRRNKLSQSGVLEKGMLAALVGLDVDGVSLSVSFVEVDLRLGSDSLAQRIGDHSRAGAQLAFAQPDNVEDVRRMLYYTTSILRGRFVLVSFANALQTGFSFCLKRLQELFTTSTFAFAEHLAPTGNSARPTITHPAYVSDPGFTGFNLSSLRKSGLTEKVSDLVLDPHANNLRDESVKRLLKDTSLDAAQADALFDSLNRSLTFTQGPPGTGKTYLGVCLTKAILATPVANSRPVLVVCKTNHALDSFLSDLIKEDIKVVRFGSRSNDELMEVHSKRAALKKTPLTQTERNRISLEKARLEGLELEVTRMCEALNVISDKQPSWDVLKEHLKTNYPSAFSQFIEADAPHQALAEIELGRKGQGFAFRCWSEGRDLKDLHMLSKEFELYLGTNPDRKSEPSDSANIEKLMAEVIAEARLSSQIAGKNSLWTMGNHERKTLLRHWMSEVSPQLLVEKTVELYRRAIQALERRRALRSEIDSRLLASSQILGMTTTACAMNSELLQLIAPRVVICEEAGEVLEAHTLCTLLPSVEHAVFIGDPLQLRPQIEEQALSAETAAGEAYSLDVSTMERMMFPTDPETAPVPFSQLRVQRRMHPDISAIPRAMLYPYLLDHESTLTHPPVAGLGSRSFWFDHQFPEDGDQSLSTTTSSQSNSFEVEMVAGLLHYLIDSGAYELGDIAVVTPYNGQLRALHRRLSNTCSVYLSEEDRQRLNDAKPMWDPVIEHGHKAEIQMTDMLRIATIDSFQGEEAKVVIFSAVRSNSEGRTGFLKTFNRINVGCSRARDGFYIFGNATLLSRVEAWKKVIDVFASQGRLAPALRLQCSRHPVHAHVIQIPEDFYYVRPCKRLCGQILACGHVCEEECHPLELHQRMQCQKPCERVHEGCGHLCNKRCGQACGKCEVVLPPITLPCGHSVTRQCYEQTDNEEIICNAKVEHVNFACGHKMAITCSKRNARQICGERCGTILSCGHVCSGSCGVCVNADAHVPCKETCAKLQACGHHCINKCHDGDCPPCEAPCQRSCEHGTCPRRCNKVCEPCIRTCSAGCEHTGRCTMACSLPCLRLPCNEPCSEVFSCGHLCPSLCGERCPLKCPECLDKRFPTSHVIGLPCGHYFGLDYLDKTFGFADMYDMDQEGRIQSLKSSPKSTPLKPSCPTCGHSAANVRRYAAITKLHDFPDVLDRMVAKFGRKMKRFQHEMHLARNKLEQGAGRFSDFCSRIRPSPLAGAANQNLVKERGNCMSPVQDRISRYLHEVIRPIQEQLSKAAQIYCCGGLPSSPVWPFDLRLEFLIRDCRWTALGEALRMAEYLETLDDLSEQLHAIARGLRTEIAAQIPLNLEHIASLMVECEKRNLKTLEVEVHLLRLQFLILARKAKIEESSEPETSVLRVTSLVKLQPDTCAKFTDCFNAIKKTLEGPIGEVPIHYSLELRDHWEQWGAHEIGQLITCPKSHLYSIATFPKSCPECGHQDDTEVKPKPNTIDYEAHLCPPEAFMHAVRSASKSRDMTAPTAAEAVQVVTEACVESTSESKDVARLGEDDPQEVEVAKSSPSETAHMATNGDDVPGEPKVPIDINANATEAPGTNKRHEEKEPSFFQRLLDDPAHLACFMRKVAIS